MSRVLTVCLLVCLPLAAQEIPAPTDLSGNIFVVKKTWGIGGAGNWGSMTSDPAAGKLFIAHSSEVQVVDLDSGTMVGRIGPLCEAHAIALDDTNEFGYIADGPISAVQVFDRHSFQVVAQIHTAPNPSAIVFEPQTKLLFVFSGDAGLGNASAHMGGACHLVAKSHAVNSEMNGEKTSADNLSAHAETGSHPVAPGAQGSARTSPPTGSSVLTIIDPEKHTEIAEILLPGKLGVAQVDGKGMLYVNILDRDQILALDASGLASFIRNRGNESGAPQPNHLAGPEKVGIEKVAAVLKLDWSRDTFATQSSYRDDNKNLISQLRFFKLGPACIEPRGLAMDVIHQRLFAACRSKKMIVLNADTGDIVASIPIGPGADAVGYDASHGLIFTANGGGQGTLSIIRQTVTDTYSVIQILPTQFEARTLTINPTTGDVYVVTDALELDLAGQASRGVLKTTPVKVSFQVLVIGH